MTRRTGVGLSLLGAIGIAAGSHLIHGEPAAIRSRPAANAAPAGPRTAAAASRLPARAGALARNATSPAKAAAMALQAVTRNPDDARGHEALHAAYEALGAKADVPGLYAGLRARRPASSVLVLEHGRALLRAGRFAEAEVVLKELRRDAPEYQEARRLLGLTLLEAGHPQRAADELLALRALDAGTARYLGIALVLSGRPGRGAAILERAVGQDPNAETLLYLARAYRSLGRLQAAESLLLSLLEGADALPAARAELARLYLEKSGGRASRPDRALYHAERAYREGQRCYEVLAQAYALNGEPDLAVLTAEAAAGDDACPPVVKARCLRLLASLTATTDGR